MNVLKMRELDLKGKRVLIREDLNVPIKNGNIVNDARIQAALPTIKLALDGGAKVMLMSHLGRPQEGLGIAEQTQASLQLVAERLCALLSRPVPLINDYLVNDGLDTGTDLCLLENVRINEGEKEDNDELAQQYASLCDIFVMDAFGTAHRVQASTHGVAKYAPVACAGPLLEKELDSLERSLNNPKRPMLAIVGGAKVSSKLRILESLATKVEHLIVGGGIANTFLAAAGMPVGRSLYEVDMLDCAKQLLQSADIPLPVDVVVAKEFSESAVATIKSVSAVAEDDMIMDIGPETAAKFAALIEGMSTILWNGPLGVFEFEQFANGSAEVARAIAKNKGYSIAGGGETITAIAKYGITDQVSYISTGGGAFLEFVQGETLPAVKMLQTRAHN